jgi:hypothetical protein
VLGAQFTPHTVAHSNDNGTTWIPSTTGFLFTDFMSGVAYDASTGFWVGVGSGTGLIAYSSNGDTWTQTLSPNIPSTTTFLNAVATNGAGLWLAVGYNLIYSTNNGSNWTLATGVNASTIYGHVIAHGAGLWVASTGVDLTPLSWSTNGLNWTACTYDTSPPFVSVLFGPGSGAGVSYSTLLSLWIAFGSNGTFLNSTDGKYWITNTTTTIFNGGSGVASI